MSTSYDNFYSPAARMVDGVVELHINQSPFQPSAAVVHDVVASASDLRVYPDLNSVSLKAAIAAHHGVSPENILVAAGGDGVLDAVFRAFARSYVNLTDPTYGILYDLCRAYRATPVVSSWNNPFSEHTSDASLSCIVNPNSPDGRHVSPSELESVLSGKSGYVVIDEAYAPFSGGSIIPRLADHSKWMVVRSFSKAYALAGLRIGYLVAAPSVVSMIARLQLPYPVSSLALVGAEAALRDSDYLNHAVSTVCSERERLKKELSALGWDPGVSKGNFVYVRPPRGDASTWLNVFLEAGIAVRWFPEYDAERVRIAVSTASVNDSVVAVAAGAA
jgi:histidinol-phosphate aminotransferase